ncbi:hypothetical protein K443DRAFT_491966 [Laccaria amethystina LaAM-08-1]|uniref:Uncharacterized protein n=1 Tax=Laccaria amethystina LaAM-08-1 TaxID=1095629 RepID=A0A0C9WMQ2_9AGAR|nr:hypothetical protein K443DRAFT_491966 [Laccaria amethystina LaAM-08-1]
MPTLIQVATSNVPFLDHSRPLKVQQEDCRRDNCPFSRPHFAYRWLFHTMFNIPLCLLTKRSCKIILLNPEPATLRSCSAASSLPGRLHL